jgi:Ca2+-binding RTX toxin-like protein
MRSGRLALMVTAVVIVQAVAYATIASAAAICSFDAATAHVQVTTGDASVSLGRLGDAIALNGSVCGGATVTTTDTIDISGSGFSLVKIDTSTGAFAPGKTDEGDGGSEIEITLGASASELLIVGSAGDDAFTLGYDHGTGDSRANLDATEAVSDADLTVTSSVARFTVDAAEGSDAISLAGDTWSGGPAAKVIAWGGPGDDTFTCGLNDNELDGQDGADTIECSRTDGPLTFFLSLAFSVRGSGTCCGTGTDSLLRIENATGGAEPDEMYGTPDANVLRGRGGDDTIYGLEGDDVLDGGANDGQSFGDLVAFPQATDGVRADLGAGFAKGEGADTLTGFEGLSGSGGDDRLTGSDGADLVAGEAGADTIVATPGNDTYTGGNWLQFPDSSTRHDAVTFAGIDNGYGLLLDLKASDAYSVGPEHGRIYVVERITGTGMDDLILGNGKPNTLKGLAGDDVLRGRGQADSLYGGIGDDLVDGGAGLDLCHGGAGVNALVDC